MFWNKSCNNVNILQWHNCAFIVAALVCLYTAFEYVRVGMR